MSLVGTRPILQDELLKYELHHRARIAIKPGITGMWQVSGRSDITDFEEVVRLDTEYISNTSISAAIMDYSIHDAIEAGLNFVVLQKKEECQKYLCFHWMNHRLLLVKSIKIIPM